MVRIASILIAIAIAAGSARAGTPESRATDNLPAYSVADPTAPEITDANLLASERFWPYQAALALPYAPASSERALPAGSLGVVIRVQPGARVRIDFGRDGLFTMSVRNTDLVERANAIRTGAAQKTAPNLTFALAPRLLDGEAAFPKRIRLDQSFDRTGYLCLFTDPREPGFTRLASLIAPLANRDGVLPVLLPQRPLPQRPEPDAELLPALRAAGWKGAFALSHMSKGYTHTLIDGEIATPTLALYSAEGRLIWSGPLAGKLPPGLEIAWTQAFPHES